MKVGFTGTRVGMSDSQKEGLHIVLSSYDSVEFHHGDCVGADEQAYEVAKACGARTVGHPPLDTRLRAFTKNDEMRKPKPFLARNHDIVDETEVLTVAPKTDEEELRSGTWATARYAVKTDKEVLVLKRGE